MGEKILHYRISYQSFSLLVIKFLRREMSEYLENEDIYIESGQGNFSYFERFEEALININGVWHISADDNELLVVKDPNFQNWGRIIDDVIYCCLMFLNPEGSAMKMSNKNGNNVGKLVSQKFAENEPKYPNKKEKGK